MAAAEGEHAPAGSPSTARNGREKPGHGAALSSGRRDLNSGPLVASRLISNGFSKRFVTETRRGCSGFLLYSCADEPHHVRYGRAMDRVQDRDDWFAGLEPEDGRARAEHAVDEWLPPDEAPPQRTRLRTIDRRVLVLAAVGLVALIGVLAAAGVFSSSHNTPTPTVTSTPATTPTTTSRVQTSPAPSLPAPAATLKPGETG